MNKPVTQLDLIPAADAKPADGNSLLAVLGRAGVPPEKAEQIVAAAGPDDFDWSTEDSVVVRPRPGVAIYENKYGDIVIRTQNAEHGPQDDHFAYVSHEGLPAVIKALKECLP
jgi:hypothetical protein